MSYHLSESVTCISYFYIKPNFRGQLIQELISKITGGEYGYYRKTRKI